MALNEYTDLVTARNNDRIKYAKILEEEKLKINQKIQKIIDKFDDSLFKLFQIKLKYNSAIYHEHLKIIRLSKMLNDNNQRKQQIKIYKLIK